MNQEAEENKIIINQYRSLIRSINKDLNKDEKRSIRKAFNLAISAHNNSRRESGELYISHPISVAKIVGNDIGLGSTSIICLIQLLCITIPTPAVYPSSVLSLPLKTM